VSTNDLHPYPPDHRLTRDAALETIVSVAPNIDRHLASDGISYHDRCDIGQDAAVAFLSYVDKVVANPAGLFWRIAVRLAADARRRPRTLPLFAEPIVPSRSPPWDEAEEHEYRRGRAEAALERCPPAVARVAHLALAGRTTHDIALALLAEQGADPEPTAVHRVEHRVRVYLSRFVAIARRAA
jgi:DNA-directed RNA polymerase specialized sigma24 family protein